MRGRRPKPTSLHRLEGTFNATDHRDREREPVPERRLFAPPKDLTRAQKAAWRYVIAHAPKGVLFQIDAEILRAWVETKDRRDEAGRILQATRGNEEWINSHAHRVLDHTTALMIRLAAELGFSPAARPRIKVDPVTGQEVEASSDPWSMMRVIKGGKRD